MEAGCNTPPVEIKAHRIIILPPAETLARLFTVSEFFTTYCVLLFSSVYSNFEKPSVFF